MSEEVQEEVKVDDLSTTSPVEVAPEAVVESTETASESTESSAQ